MAMMIMDELSKQKVERQRQNQLRVLISAYACEPGEGSEPGVGWNWARQASRFCQVWLLTRVEYRERIEAALAREPLPNVHWVYFDLPRWARFWKKGERGWHLHYYLWQLGAYFAVRKLHRRIAFDVAHHVTFVNYWMPSFLPLLPVPFVWGPVGGGETAPLSFWYSFSLRGKVYEFVRALARRRGELDPFVRLSSRRAAAAFATTESTKRRVQRLGCREVSIYSETGLPSEELQRLADIPLRQGDPFRVVSIASLIHWKGFHLGLDAFARFHRRFPGSEYWLIGDGPERKRLEKLAWKLGVTERVTFWGWIPRSQVLKRLAECDALLHPSLHDSGGWVCLEAMAAGRPVVCLDLGGPGFQVTEESGIKVPALSPQQAASDLAVALGRLASDAGFRARLGQAGRRRVQAYFSWEKKGEYMTRVYHQMKASSRPGGFEATSNADALAESGKEHGFGVY